MQLEQENQTALNKVDNLERMKTSSQNQLNQTERTNEELHAEKRRLEQLLCEEEELQESLQKELAVLREEQKETHEKLSQVTVRSSSELSCIDIRHHYAHKTGFSFDYGILLATFLWI